MIDLNSLSVDERATFRVYVVGGEGIEDSSGFEVVGPNSAEFQKASAQIAAQAMRDAKGGVFADVDTDEGAAKVQAQSQARLVSVALSCVVGIFGFTEGGEPLPYSRATVEKLLTLRPRWALHITRAVETEANFTKG